MSVETDLKRSSLPVLIPLGPHAKNPPVKLTRPVYVIGTKPSCRIHLVSSTVSNTHALLAQTRHLTYIRDLNSRTHVYVNGNQVKEAVLHDGDLLSIGRFTFKYQGPKKDHGAEPPAPPASLIVDGSPLPVPMEERTMVIGRRQTCDIPLLEESVSTAHAVIFCWEGKRFVRDLWSRTGTFVNGKKIHEQELADGDLIRCGETDITYALSSAASFAVVEGASDSVIAATPAAEEVDQRLAIAQSATPAMPANRAPLEVIVPPLEQMRDEGRDQSQDQAMDHLGLEPMETVEPTPHDTAHIPLSIPVPAIPVPTAQAPVESRPILPAIEATQDLEIDALPLTPISQNEPTPEQPISVEEDSDLPRRGWRSGVGEGEEPVADATPSADHAQELVAALEQASVEPPTVEPQQQAAAPIEPVISESDIADVLAIEDDPTAEVSEPPLIAHGLEDSIAAQAGEMLADAEVSEGVTGQATTDASVVTADSVTLASEPIALPAEAIEPPSLEVIDPTDPTPESALDLPVAEEFPLDSDLNASGGDLTDTTFGRNLEEFEGASLGPIIVSTEQAEDSAATLSPITPPTEVAVKAEIEFPDTIGHEQVLPDIQPHPLELEHEEAPAFHSAPAIELEPTSDAVRLPDDFVATTDATSSPSDFEPLVELDPEPTQIASELPLQLEPDAPSPIEPELPVGLAPSDIEQMELADTLSDFASPVPDVDVISEPHPASVQEFGDQPVAEIPSVEASPEVSPAHTLLEPATPAQASPWPDFDLSSFLVAPAVAAVAMQPEPPTHATQVVEDQAIPPANQPAVEMPLSEMLSDEVPDTAIADQELATATIPDEDVIIAELPDAQPPVVEVPVTDTPPTESLVTEAPFTETPVTETPVTETPVIAESVDSIAPVIVNHEIETLAVESVGEFVNVTEPLDGDSPETISPDDTAMLVLAADDTPVVGAPIVDAPFEDVRVADAPVEYSPVDAALEPEASTFDDVIELPAVDQLPIDLEILDTITPDDQPVAAYAGQSHDFSDLARSEPAMPAIETGVHDLLSVPELDEIEPHAPIPEESQDKPSPLAMDQAMLQAIDHPAEGDTLTLADTLAQDATPLQTELSHHTDAFDLSDTLISDTLNAADENVVTMDGSTTQQLPFDFAATFSESIEPTHIESTPIEHVELEPAPVDIAPVDAIETAPFHGATFDESPFDTTSHETATFDAQAIDSATQQAVTLDSGAVDISPDAPHDILPPEAEDILVSAPPAPIAETPIASPAMRPRDRTKPRVIRNGFGQNPQSPKPGTIEIPPFADTITGLGGGQGAGITLSSLSQPPVRVADVFSEMGQPDSPADSQPVTDPLSMTAGEIFNQEVAKSLPTASLMDLGNESAEASTPALGIKPARAPRGRGVRANMQISPTPVIALDDEEAMNNAAQRRRTLMRRTPKLLVAMLVLIGLAIGAVMLFVPERTRVQATLTFKNAASLTQAELRKMQADQLRRLGQEGTRNVAVRMLENRHPGTPRGFLDNPEQYGLIVTNPETRWPDGRVGEFIIRHDGTDPVNDPLRLEAVALALYDSNSTLANETRTLKQTLETLRTRIDTDKRRMDDFKLRAERERAIVEARPTKAQIDQLKADDATRENEYNAAVRKYKEAQADLEKLKGELDQEIARAAQTVDPLASDADLTKLTKEADALAEKIAAARKVRADLAADARATLDAAYDEFKKQADSASQMTKDNPELAAYVQSATNLQQAIRELTDQSIKRQQEEYTALGTFKTEIDDKMKERKADLMANDPKLKELVDDKEITTRKINAAKGSGLTSEAADLEARLKFTDNLIKAQQELVANDPVYNTMISGLQKMIDEKQRSINEDRKRTDEKLASMKQSFAKATPMLEKLPVEQKELATSMQNRLAQIDAARKQYASAADASAADTDTSIKRMTDELKGIQTNIELRKKQLVALNNEATRKQQLDEKQTAVAQKAKEVEALSAALGTAQASFESNRNKLRDAEIASDKARASAESLDEAVRQIDILERQQAQSTREWDLKKEQADRAIEPVEPTEADIRTLGTIDNRFKYASIAAGSIFLIFTFWIILTLLSAARESQYAYTPAFETLETPRTKSPAESDAEEEPAVA